METAFPTSPLNSDFLRFSISPVCLNLKPEFKHEQHLCLKVYDLFNLLKKVSNIFPTTN